MNNWFIPSFSLLQTGKGEVEDKKDQELSDSSDSSDSSDQSICEKPVEVKPLPDIAIKRKLKTVNTEKVENPPRKKYKQFNFRINWKWMLVKSNQEYLL